MAYFPAEPYLYRADDPPDVEWPRPLSQGDVFVDVPLVRAATPNPRHEGQWQGQIKSGLGMIVTHPCASRSQTTFKLQETLSVAPIIRCPDEWTAPWDGYYSFFPLPGLRNRQDYVANLNAVCPVRTELLVGRRIACLNRDGLEALFHRLAMNALRFPEVPTHFHVEAERLSNEIDLWEFWIQATSTEDGFQEWLNEEFSAEPVEDAGGDEIEGAWEPQGVTRREALAFNRAELEQALREELDG